MTDLIPQYKLTLMYSKKKDMIRTKKTWKKLAKQGNEKAMFNLGLMYYKGVGVKKDHQKAMNYFAASSLHAYKPATEVLSILKETKNVCNK